MSQREIKFRAWDVANKEMVYNVHLNDGKPVKPGYQWFDQQNTVRDSEPMQYTGQRDKNDVEIYEGDSLYAEGNFELESEGLQFVGHVVWDENDARFEVVNFHGRFEYIPKGCIVRGNVFKNADLLETAGESK